MADITTGLPRLRPEELQAQQDRARLAALRGPVERVLDAGANAIFDAGTMLPRALVGLGNQLIRVPNAFGVGIPAQRLPGDSPDALPEFKVAPYSTAQNTGSVGGSWGPPVAAPAKASVVSFEPAFAQASAAGTPRPTPAPVPVAAAPRTPMSEGTKTAGGMPAGAPAPRIPGETGHYVGDRLVPYGTTMGFGNGGFVGLAGEYRGYNEAQDPIAMMKRGYDMQLSYLDEVQRKIGAPQYTTGDKVTKLVPGWAERAGAISRAAGNPDFTATGMSGANTVNNNQTSAHTAAVKAVTDMYGFDQNLAGNQVAAAANVEGHRLSAGATAGAAQLGYNANVLRDATENRKLDTDTVQSGGEVQIINGLPVVVPTFTSRKAIAAGMPTAAEARQSAKRVPGKEYTDGKGNRAIYNTDGSYTPVK